MEDHFQEARRKLALAMPFVRETRMAIDGGSHHGEWLLPLSEAFEFVRGFEPALDCHAQLFYMPENVHVRDVALGSKMGRGVLSTTAKRSGISRSRFVAFEDTVPWKGSGEVMPESSIIVGAMQTSWPSPVEVVLT